MKLTDYGRIDVMIRHCRTNLAGFCNQIILIYPHVYTDSKMIYCPLNTKEGYPHKTVYYHKYEQFIANKKYATELKYFDAIEYLKKYCKHYRLDFTKFHLCHSYNKGIINPLDEEGNTKCPIESGN